MWDLVATAAAGLHAGAGLQAAIAGAPSASDSFAFNRYTSRTRITGALLATISTSACLATYFSEDRGALWLVAAAGVGIGLPFNLLLMAPPAPMLAPAPVAPRLDPYAARSPTAHSYQSAGGPGSNIEDSELARASPVPGNAGADHDSAFAAADAASAYSGVDEPGIYGRPAPIPPGSRRLMYAKSGVLVRPEALSSSYSKKYWFGAVLSLVAFGCMMSILATGKDAPTYTMTPF